MPSQMPRLPQHFSEVTDIAVRKQAPCGQDVVLLLDAVESERVRLFENLIRVCADGTFVWRAKAPGSSTDSFVDFDFRDETLVAWTHDGFRVKVDAETGRIVESAFTK